MTKQGIEVLDDVIVDLVQHVGSDLGIVEAARISQDRDRRSGSNAEDGSLAPVAEKDAGLINYLIRERHGTPFEHNSITFRVEAPIFVFREWHRHRMQSYNEMSGRYTELLPRFYAPGPDRALVNVGSSARPEMAPADPEVVHLVHENLLDHYKASWVKYQLLLDLGVAKEVARLVLPVGTMSQMYATANLRAWLHFLSLRTNDPRARVVSRPQREIEMAAEKVEVILERLFPVTLSSFNANGRTAP